VGAGTVSHQDNRRAVLLCDFAPQTEALSSLLHNIGNIVGENACSRGGWRFAVARQVKPDNLDSLGCSTGNVPKVELGAWHPVKANNSGDLRSLLA
jgi:hypothetical protein